MTSFARKCDVLKTSQRVILIGKEGVQLLIYVIEKLTENALIVSKFKGIRLKEGKMLE